MDHPLSDEKVALEFPVYMRQLAARLRAGADAYGDSSFHKTGPELCRELSQELLDICGWGFVLWSRIQVLESKLQNAEQQLAEASQSSRPSPSHSP